MKAKEIADKTKEELLKLLNEKKGSLDKFRFDIGFGKNKNVKQGSTLKKEIARILTTINQKKND